MCFLCMGGWYIVRSLQQRVSNGTSLMAWGAYCLKLTSSAGASSVTSGSGSGSISSPCSSGTFAAVSSSTLTFAALFFRLLPFLPLAATGVS